MKTLKYIFIFLSIVLIAACRDKIDITVGSTYTRLVINGTITTDTMSHKVTLTKTADYFSDKPTVPVSNALVYITDGKDTFNLIESLANPGEYLTTPNVYGIAGHTYNLNIKNVNIGNGQSEYIASSHLPPISKIDSFTIIPATQQRGPANEKEWEVDLYAKDPAETKDFYLFKVYYNNVLLSDTLDKLTWTNDDLFNGNSTNGVSLYYITNSYRKQQGLLYIKGGIKTQDKITLELDGINEDYFNFISQMQTQYQGSNPIFGGPPANAANNVLPKDKAVGFFAAYSSVKKSIIYK
jgi:hypothetical protein